MSTTAIPATLWAANTAAVDVAGTAIVAGELHVVTPGGPTSEMMVRVTNTTASQKTVTVTPGDNPPADAAGIPAVLSLTLEAGDVTPTQGWIGPLSSSRWIHKDGTVQLTVDSGMTGFVTAFQLSRKA